MCEHLRMDPKDDPEARIRELERPLADAARASELGTGVPAGPPPPQPWTHQSSFPPPPPGPPAPWPGYEPYPAAPQPQRRSNSAPLFLMFGVLAVALLVGGLVTAYLTFGESETAGTDTDTVTDSQSTTIRQTTVGDVPLPGPVGPTQVPAGETVMVAGVGQNRIIECRENTVTVSGMRNTLEITGHCIAVVVSGIENTITVDSVESIGVSGFDNRVTFHTGQPEVANSGQSNVVEQG